VNAFVDCIQGTWFMSVHASFVLMNDGFVRMNAALMLAIDAFAVATEIRGGIV
jgi:hypothetical protein